MDAEGNDDIRRRTRRFGLIGHGRIGRDVVAAWQGGTLPDWQLEAVLTARDRSVSERTGPFSMSAASMPGPAWLTDPARFFERSFDLIVDCAGPAVLARHGEAALAIADVWTVCASALADPAVLARLEKAARRGGHRLRLLPGAIAGLDGVAALGWDPGVQLELTIDVPPDAAIPAGTVVDQGSVRAVASRHPDHVNVAVAAALAGPGLDRSRLRLMAPGAGRHRLALVAHGEAGTLRAQAEPWLRAGSCHPVAAAILGALRQAARPIWVG